MLDNFDPHANLSALIDYHARSRPDAEMLVFEGRRWSWSEGNAVINKVANALLALGIGRGAKAAIVAGNSAEYFFTLWGIIRAGACAVPLSGMASAATLEAMIADSGARALFVSEKSMELIRQIDDRLSSVVAGARVAFDFSDARWAGFAEWTAAHGDTSPNVMIDDKDDFNIIYSSGTTGTPKGILHDHGTRIAYWSTRDALKFGPTTRLIISTPLYSNTTLFALLPALAWGGTTIMLQRSDAATFLALAEQERATHTMQVPVQYQRLHDFPDFKKFDLSSFQWKFCSSAPLRPELKTWLVTQWPGAFTEVYGMTEGGVGCFLHVHENPDKVHTIGRVRQGAAIRVVDENMKEVARGEVGELIGWSAVMMTGYYNRPELTAKSRWTDSEGRVWQRSGDMGRMDEDGFIVLLDRTKDMIISGGFNVYAADLEAELLRHPEVADAAVIAIPSAEWGETPLGLVVLKAGAQASAEQIRRWTNDRLGKLQRISAVELRQSLPRSSIGKLLKVELREPYWPNAGSRIA